MFTPTEPAAEPIRGISSISLPPRPRPGGTRRALSGSPWSDLRGGRRQPLPGWVLREKDATLKYRTVGNSMNRGDRFLGQAEPGTGGLSPRPCLLSISNSLLNGLWANLLQQLQTAGISCRSTTSSCIRSVSTCPGPEQRHAGAAVAHVHNETSTWEPGPAAPSSGEPRMPPSSPNP